MIFNVYTTSTIPTLLKVCQEHKEANSNNNKKHNIYDAAVWGFMKDITLF